MTSSQKPLLLGERPNFLANRRKVTGPGQALESLAPRLCEFAGIILPGGRKELAYEKLRQHFDVANAYSADGPWCAPLARGETLQLVQTLKPKVVVCLGRRAGALFGLEAGLWNAWRIDSVLEVYGRPREVMGHRFLVAAIPHPSGRCRVYNDLDVRERAHFTMREAQEAQERLNRGQVLESVLAHLQKRL